MAIYFLNLGISLGSSAFSNGNFNPYNSSSPGLTRSCAWYQFDPSGTPPPLHDDCYLITQALSPTDWPPLGQDTSPLDLQPNDYVLMRVFPADSSVPAACRMRFTVVFGRGSSTPPTSTTTSLQSPLQIVQNGQATARPVVDADNSLGTSWPLSPTNDNVWTYCLGMVHGVANTYSLNAGVTVYVPANPNTGAPAYLAVYGHDPTMKVSGGGIAVVAA